VIKDSLADKPVHEWASYDKIIQCANNYTKADDALSIVKQAVETEAATQSFDLKDDNAMKAYMGNWKLAFGYINTKKKIFEMPW
jgi:hypothetical protein